MKPTPIGGLLPWLIQRLTAIYLLFFFLFLMVYFVFFTPSSYEVWRGWISGTMVFIAISVFFLALFAHAWVGLRDVIIDYVKPLALRVTMLTLLALSLIGMAAWVAKVLFTASI